jgi:hypothetical protein
MAAFLRKARRSAILEQGRRHLDSRRGQKVDEDRTPAATSVLFTGSEPDAGAVLRRKRVLVGLLTIGLFAGGALALTGAPRAEADAPGGRGGALPPPALANLRARPGAEPLPPVEVPSLPSAEPPFPVPSRPRADAHLNREGYGHIRGGVVFLPATFSSEDGAYDLYLHFHGNTRVVAESADHAGLNAIVVVVNLGIGSGLYLDAYEEPGSYDRTLGAIGRVLGERGLDQARLRRVAIGSWSAGYGAVSRIMERDSSAKSVDAVLVLDGIHCGFLDDDRKELNVMIIAPFLRAARRAAAGDFLFSITHSEIDPGTYAGTALTAGYLLGAVGGTRGEPSPAPEHVQLRAAEGAVSKKLEKRMEPLYEATVGSFHVRGYRGNTPEHHMAHLFQMGATVMPELARRWSGR